MNRLIALQAETVIVADDHPLFRTAIKEALERKTPRASSVRYLLERRRRARKARLTPRVDLSRRPDLADIELDDLKGPSGKYRAPMLLTGGTLLVGFNEEMVSRLT